MLPRGRQRWVGQQPLSEEEASNAVMQEDNVCAGKDFYNDNARRLWLVWKLGGKIKLMEEHDRLTSVGMRCSLLTRKTQ
jgi:hypothetical protein